MYKLINNLYDEIYGSKVRPEDLLNNMNLENYHDVKFSKIDNQLIATVKCDLKNGELGIFEYSFINNKLENLIQVSPTNITIYDRKTEIENLRKEIKNNIHTNIVTA